MVTVKVFCGYLVERERFGKGEEGKRLGLLAPNHHTNSPQFTSSRSTLHVPSSFPYQHHAHTMIEINQTLCTSVFNTNLLNQSTIQYTIFNQIPLFYPRHSPDEINQSIIPKPNQINHLQLFDVCDTKVVIMVNPQMKSNHQSPRMHSMIMFWRFRPIKSLCAGMAWWSLYPRHPGEFNQCLNRLKCRQGKRKAIVTAFHNR